MFALEDIPEAAVIWVYECESPLPVLGHQFQPNRAFDCEGLSALEHEEIRLIFHSAVYLPSCDLVVNYRDGTFSKVATEDMTVVQTVSIGGRPIGVAYDPSSRRVWVADYAGTLHVFDDAASDG